MMKKVTILLTVLPALMLAPAQAEIYRWVDAEGTVHYGDQPTRGAKPADLPDVYRADPIPVKQSSTARATGGFDGVVKKLTITSPQAEQTFNDAQGEVSVQVQVEPGLPDKASIRYFMDGNPVSAETTRASSIRVAGVTPGSHTVAASVILNGSEVARARPVVFYMRKPSTIKPLQTGANNGEGPQNGGSSAPPATQSRGVLGAPRATAP